MVRKAILNEPKPLRIRVVFGIRELLRRFGYFWASKVTERIGIHKLLRRFGYFWASKVTKKFAEKYLTPSNCFSKHSSILPEEALYPPGSFLCWRDGRHAYIWPQKKPQSMWLSIMVIFSNIKLLYRQYLRQERFLGLI